MKKNKVSHTLLLVLMTVVLLLLIPTFASAATRYEETDPSVSYTGTWATGSDPSHSGGTHKVSNTTGSTAIFSFTGTSVTWIGSKYNNRGIARVYVDGAYQQDVDLYASSWQPQSSLYTISGLANSAHTIQVEVAGTKNTSSSNYYISVDAFDIVTAAPTTTRYEQTDPSVTYAGTWATGSDPSHSGGSHSVSNTAGSTATFSFTGTSVTWIGSKYNNRGIAKVYVDGVYQLNMDLYASTWQPQSSLYTKTSLANAPHTIQIEVANTKNASSSNYYVSVDAFDVGFPADTTPPSQPTNLAATAMSASRIDLSWTASTDDVGVAGYRVVRSTDGLTFFEVGTSSATSYSDTGLSPSTTYYYKVKAYDAAGNESTYSNTASATTSTPSVINRYEETSPSISYAGTWETWNNSNLSGGSETYSSVASSTASLAFYGNSVKWITAKANNRGVGKVYIDGTYDADVDLYNSSLQYQQAVYAKAGLSSTHHTIRIEVSGTKNPSSSDYRVGLDAFEIESLPDTTPPSAPSNLTGTAISTSQINLNWDPSTDNKALAGYKIERSSDGITFVEIGTSSSTSYSDSSLAPATTCYYQVRAYDTAGNNSGYSNAASATTQPLPESVRYEDTSTAIAYVGRATSRYEQTDPSVTYAGTWATGSDPSHSGGTHAVSNTTGSTATFSFTGTSVTWIGSKYTNRGIAKVYVDGVYQQDVDLYASSWQPQRALYTKSGLANISHAIQIEVTNTKNASSTNFYISVDAFDVVAPTSSWEIASNLNYSGGSESRSDATGTTATLSFNGTDVFWIATRASDRGIAKIYLDGIYQQDADLYSPTTVYQDVLFSKSGLSSGSHTLKVEVSGTKNSSSSGYQVGIDAFDVVVPPASVTTTVQTDPNRPDAYGGWFRTIPTITLSSNVAGTTYYQWDSTTGVWTTYATPFPALEGTHTLYFYAVDGVGNTESAKVKRFKVDTAIAATGTHAGCAGCHGLGTTYVGGDHVTYWTGTPHDTALSTYPAGCERCHSWTSTLSKLLRNPIPDTAGVEHIVIGNDNTQCGACHTDAKYAYSGMAAFQGSKHFQTASSNLALTTFLDASYPYGMCGNCHNPHGQAGTTDYLRADGSTLCAACHDDAALPPKPQNYSYQGAASFSGTEHGSTNNAYNVWPSPNDTGAGIGSGGATSGECINCHNPHGKFTKQTNAEGENLCYGGSGGSGGCHTTGTGSSTGRNIYQEFTSSTDLLAHHSVIGSEQSAAGSKLECANCHNAHLNTASNRVSNPENKSSLYTGTMTDPKSGLTVFNYVGFCDKCHNGFPPSGVTAPSSLIEIKRNYESNPADSIGGGIDETGDWHGVKSGSGWGGSLTTPYNRGMAALVCADCHESHGSSNVYHFKSTVNGKTGISLTDSSGKGANEFCTACHSGEYHTGCVAGNCHGGDPVPPTQEPPLGPTPCFYCHSHSGITNWVDPNGIELTGCSHCHGDWYQYNNLP